LSASFGIRRPITDYAIAIDFTDYMLNDGTAVVLHRESELEYPALAQLRRLSVERRSKLTVVIPSGNRVTGACLPNIRGLRLNTTQISDEDWFEVSGWVPETIDPDNMQIGGPGDRPTSGGDPPRSGQAVQYRGRQLCNASAGYFSETS